MTEAEVAELVERAAAANAAREVTGALLAVQGAFFQILEGPEGVVDELFETIRRDARHTDVVKLGEQSNVEMRFFPNWSMRRVAERPNSTEMSALVHELANAPEAEQRRLAHAVALLMREAMHAA